MLNSPLNGFVLLNIIILSVIIYIIMGSFADVPDTFNVSRLLSRNIFLSAAITAFIIINLYGIKLLIPEHDY